MKNTAANELGHFATILNAGMQQLDITLRELGRQLGISHEHAWKLQTGEALPSRLLVEKTANVVGNSVEKLQTAVEHDKMMEKSGKPIRNSKFKRVLHAKSLLLKQSKPKRRSHGS